MDSLSEYPLHSVVIINWDAKPYLVDCIRSVFASTYPSLEVILVDNASVDGSIDELKTKLAQQLSGVRIIVHENNYGAAQALTTGVAASRAKYVSFLASDTRVEPNCFQELVTVLESDERIGAVEAKLLLMDQPQRFDHAGEYLNQFGLLLQRHAGQEIDRGQFDYPTDIFSAKGTALTVRRDVFNSIGGFDTDYFMFLEETDLCWRIWLKGYRVVFVPQAVIYHASGVSIRSHRHSKYLVKYYGTRNYITTLLKNMGGKLLIKILPLHIFMWFSLALFFMVKQRVKEGSYIIKGIVWNFIHFREVLRKRRKIQKSRVISDSFLMTKIMQPVKLSYLLDRVKMW